MPDNSYIEDFSPATEPGKFSWPRTYPNMEMRLLANSVLDPVTGCWIWVGKRRKEGGYQYGHINIRIDGRVRTFKAHRVSYEEFCRPIPASFEVDHTCVNPSCINPAHLEAVPSIVNLSRRTFGRRRA